VWLRLLGKGSVQAGAIGEVLRRAGRDPVVDATLKAVRQWRESLPASAEQSEKARQEMMKFEKLLAAADKREALMHEQALREGERKGKAEGLAAGKAEGKAEGKEEGLAAGLRVAITDLCEVLGVKVGAARQAKLAAMRLDELEALRAHLKQHRAWPSARR